MIYMNQFTNCRKQSYSDSVVNNVCNIRMVYFYLMFQTVMNLYGKYQEKDDAMCNKVIIHDSNVWITKSFIFSQKA